MNTFVTPNFHMPNCDKLSIELANNSKYSRLEWLNALESSIKLASDSSIDPDALIYIAHNSESPSQLIMILELFNEYAKEYPYNENAFNMFLGYTEGASFNVKSWLSSIEYFYKWLIANSRHAGLRSILSYISGCAVNKSSFDADLQRSLANTLDTYGFQD